MACPHPVRYPVGFKHRAACRGYVVEDSPPTDGKHVTVLDYVAARKQIYAPLFQRAVQKHHTFVKLQKRLRQGENLLIVEVDGPHQESLQHYVDKYGVSPDFFVDSTVQMNRESLTILLEDPLHPFGHG